ncbi:Uncharacterised protein [uncultured archaeon]|nr:Uncharacterised protein [uncultured archaeon]
MPFVTLDGTANGSVASAVLPTPTSPTLTPPLPPPGALS